VAAVLALLAAAIFLRSKAPPEAARLLPESDGIVRLNLKPGALTFTPRTILSLNETSWVDQGFHG
jgi:hypothetical protein